MSGAPQLDGRRAKALEAELLRRAQAVLSGDGNSRPAGPIARAIFGAAARIGEEVVRRLDLAPGKQSDNFYTAAGIGRDPARAATLPVALKLVDGATKVSSAPAQLQLTTDAEDGSVFFETETRIDLAPGKIAALAGIDASSDSITLPSTSVMAGILPSAAPIARRLRGGAAAGATKLQIDPAAGLEPGMLLRIGAGEAARDYEAVAVQGDLVTIEPALETGLAQDAPAVEVSRFAPFAAVSRNHQAHALYLGHSTLLDIPSAVTISVDGAPLPAGATWSWWGKIGDDDPPAWQALQGPGPSFTKLPGKLVKKEIAGHESLWLRAQLPPGKSPASVHARDVRIAIGGAGPCGDRSTRCADNLAGMNIGFEAIANTTPVVTNSAFHPFGREPRLYDSFYVGSNEAFSKAGADVSLCFRFAGGETGRMAAIKETDTSTRIFGVGADGLLYRALMPTPIGGATQNAELRPVPSPSRDGRTALFQARSPIALWKTLTVEYVAVAAANGTAIYVAQLDIADGLPKSKWWRLPLPPSNNVEVDALAVHSGAGTPVLYALVGPDLYVWTGVSDGALPTNYGTVVQDLVQVEPSDPLTGMDSVLIVEETMTAGQVKLVRKGAVAGASPPFARTGFLPAEALHAFIDPGDTAKLFIAGYDPVPGAWALKLAEVPAGNLTPFASNPTTLVLDDPLPVAFSPGRSFTITGPNPPPFPKRPILSVATRNPVHVSWRQSAPNILEPVLSWEPTSIGTSANISRGFVVSADYIAVQRPDVGLLFRSSAGGAVVGDIRVPAAPGYLADASQVPSSANEILHFKFSGLGVPFDAFAVTAPAASGRTILKLRVFGDPAPLSGADIVAFVNDPSLSGIEGTPANAGDIALTGTGGFGTVYATIKPSSGSTVKEIWHFTTPIGAGDWDDPGISLPGPNRYYQVLIETGRDSGWAEAALLPMGSPVEIALTAGEEVWRANNTAFEGTSLFKYSGGGAVPYPHADILLFGGQTLFLTKPGRWQSVGPDVLPNPALSWEYWNGDSWWALATAGSDGLVDDTFNFIKDGGVFFKVPRDIQPTDVGGRTSHWVRARLVGGDYGEAKVTVKTDPITGDQSVNRDLGTIRAPYVVALNLGYCAREAVAPEIILTQDSLGTIDQTSANQAGLEFPVFQPVGELMSPVEAAAEAADPGTDCADPCPPPPEAGGSPCDSPGAHDSCDSPCIAPDDRRRPAGAAVETGFVRGLMVGFERGFAGDTISLYMDAEPGAAPVELAADMLRGGRFVPIAVVEDSSHGLTEPGILTLALPVVPDRSDLLGAPAHWLRLRPKTNSAGWSPQLNGIHLNAVLARSVETRVMERLGASTGLEGQVFRLSEAPIDPDSLVLRVLESLAEEDDPDGLLDVAEFPSGLPGKWVRWSVADDLSDESGPARAFLLDSEQGIVSFGDGKAGRIPPVGTDILAETYARVIGRRANGVPTGRKLQLLAPLAGVEAATALDFAAGGSDSEAPEGARRRAPAKVRHGRRILTEADLEDHALTLSPAIAQVRAEARGGGIRLVVALKGAEARPSPAALRQFEAAIREVAGYGIARPGGLTVVGPRLLPIAVDLVLRPLSPDSFAEAAERAKRLLTGLFDPATGNHDGRGWPLGRLPDGQDIAAALNPIEALALPVRVDLRRADRDAPTERQLPASIPSDVLVRLDPGAIAFERPREAAA